eukprot:CAMPEP_0113681312 /NCGR_PEP_ID=MMETSP0038_2-20120614/11907_1 /TAXON_ID=2898 /ORGANISM="Cryptomonas paramecium" /LENGTH=227 /DNA_ID=CAMNT_0000599995 /DNA_START=763 /DNA_END=1442 /DNA_ORIENTATION=- /assembly_acc=CAM_ASM_000170
MLKKLIPKTGGLKYLVTVHVHCLDFPNGIPRLPEGSEELNVIWIRGAKLASTKAVPLASSSSSRNASMCIDEKMVLICTFYRKKDGSFDEKKSKFLIKAGPLGCCDRGRGTEISKKKIDLSSFAEAHETASAFNMKMETYAGLLGNLKVTIACQWLKDARATPSDDMSNFSSRHSEASCDGSGSDEIGDDEVPRGFPPPLSDADFAPGPAAHRRVEQASREAEAASS